MIFLFRIWNFEGKTYFFETNNTGEYNGKKFKSCHLYVIDNNNIFFTNYLCSGGFQYYGDYLYEKNKPENKGKKFTYRDFINIQENQTTWSKNSGRQKAENLFHRQCKISL